MKQLTLLMLLLPFFVTAQTKKLASSQLDVDKQYVKYKDQKTITITTSSGSFEANVEIELTSDGKPARIFLWGQTSNRVALNDVMEEMKGNKLANRYVSKGNSTEPAKYGTIVMEVFTKGTQYAKYGAERKVKPLGEKDQDPFTFHFEVGDKSRKAANSKSFDF
jgi:hypothetical protein